MEAIGQVLDVVQDSENEQIVKVKINTHKTTAMCSVSYNPKSDGANPCAGCTGCSSAGRSGIFAVYGNELNALNTTNKKLKKYDVVVVSTTGQKQVLQAFIAVGLPIIFAVLGFIVLFRIANTEGFGILGAFLGLFLGIGIALIFSKLNEKNKLPNVRPF